MNVAMYKVKQYQMYLAKLSTCSIEQSVIKALNTLLKHIIYGDTGTSAHKNLEL